MAKRDDVIHRVKNLMDLAKSENPHEAELAAQRAQEMIERHRITDDEMRIEEDYSLDNAMVVVLMRSGRILQWHHTLAVGVATANYCRYTQAGDQLIALGRDVDLSFVEFLWDYLYEECERRWKQMDRDAKIAIQVSEEWAVNFGVQRLQGVKARNSFLLGMAARLTRRLLAAKEKASKEAREEAHQADPNTDNSEAVMRIDQQLVALQSWENKLQKEIERSGKKKEFKNDVDHVAFFVGQQEAGKVHIPENRPIEAGEENEDA